MTKTKPEYTKEELDGPAWDTLDLTEAERISVRYESQLAGIPTQTALLDYIAKYGRADGVLETARALTLRQYLVVEAAWKAAPKPKTVRPRR